MTKPSNPGDIVSDVVLNAFVEDAEKACRMGVKYAFGTRADIALSLGRELQSRRMQSGEATSKSSITTQAPEEGE